LKNSGDAPSFVRPLGKLHSLRLSEVIVTQQARQGKLTPPFQTRVLGDEVLKLAISSRGNSVLRTQVLSGFWLL